MSIVEYLSQPFWQRLGLTLLHFLWQGLAVAVLVGVFIRMLRLKHGNARYGAYLLAFIAMIACPAITFTAIDIEISANTEPVTVTEQPEVVDSFPPPYTALPAVDVLPEVETIRPAIPASPDSIPLGQRISSWLNVSMPWALVIWMAGVAVLSVRLLMGFVGVYRWRHHLEPLPERLVQRIVSLSEVLGMRRFTRVFISPTVLQAMAVGYLRPMVLLPVAMLTQMQPEMLEAVIAHELAHIRRFDLWINLIQRITETLLFYHPAVWWLSNCLRRERELCCDELAVKVTGRRLTYASTLESIGRARFMSKQPVLAAGLGQDKKPTLGRVRHILGLKPAQRNCPFWLAGVITVLFLAALVIPTTLALTNQSDEKLNDLESIVVEGIGANRDKFKCGHLAWSNKQITTRFADSNRPATELAGKYELWWDGSKKIATKYVRDEVHKDPEGNFSVEKGEGGTSYDGGILSWKPDFHSDNWLGPEVTRWRGLGSQDWLIRQKSKLDHVTKDWSVIDANGAKLIRCMSKNMNETARDYGGYSIRDYDSSKGYGLVNEEWYNPNGSPRMKHTVKMLEVIPGGWFPVEVDFKSFAITDGKVYSRNHYALDIERCSFNDKSAFPAGIFKGAVDKQLKYQEKLQKYLAMELRGISDVKEAAKADKIKQGAREAIEKFVAAALAGDLEKAREYAHPDELAVNQIADFNEIAKGQDLWIMAVVADDFDAIAVSSVIFGDHERIGPLVFFLDREPQDGRDNWWVHDIDMETPDSAEVELKQFLEKHPQAKKVPYENKPAVQVSAQELVAKIIESERRIEDIQLHMTCTIPAKNLVFYEYDWGYDSGKEFYAGFRNSTKPGRNEISRTTQITRAFDGQNEWSLRVSSEDKQPSGAIFKPSFSNFRSMMTFNTLLGFDAKERSRLSFGEAVAQAESISVSDNVEFIDGHPCYVIEAVNLETDTSVNWAYDVRAWVDYQRDCRLLKFEKYRSISGKNRFKVVSRRVDNIKLKQVDGIWLPIEGRRTTFSTNDYGPPKGMTLAQFAALPTEEQERMGVFKLTPMSPPRRLEVDVKSIRVNKGIPPERFTVAFPDGCEVYNEFTGNRYVVGQPSEREAALSDAEWIEQMAGLSVGELIDILRDSRIGKDKKKWFAAIHRLVEIGSTAVPELVSELRRTEKPQTQSKLALTLRAIGDRKAVPGLIDGLGRSGFSSDYGIGEARTQLDMFIQQHQLDPAKKSLGLARPVREITIALEKLTGHTEGHDHFHAYDLKYDRLGSYTITPEIRDRQRQHRRQVAERWRKWWQANKDNIKPTETLPKPPAEPKPARSERLERMIMSAPEGSILTLAIVPNVDGSGRRPSLTKEEYQRHVEDLARNGPFSGSIRGESFQWSPIKGDSTRFRDLPLSAYKDRNYLLLCARAQYVMMPELEGKLAWGLEKVETTQDEDGKPTISIQFDEKGSELLYELTRANIGNHLAISVDGWVLSAPTIETSVRKSADIRGDFTEEQMHTFVEELRKGMTPVDQQTIKAMRLIAEAADKLNKQDVAKMGPRQVVENFLIAGLGGLNEKLRWFVRPGSAVDKILDSTDLSEELLDGYKIKVVNVYASSKDAFVVTSDITDQYGEQIGQFMFYLSNENDNWSIYDLDAGKADRVRENLTEFLSTHSDVQVENKILAPTPKNEGTLPHETPDVTLITNEPTGAQRTKAQLTKPEINKTSDGRAKLMYSGRYVYCRDLAKWVIEKIDFITDKNITCDEGKNQISIVCPTTGDAETVSKFLQEVDVEPIKVRMDLLVVETYPDVELDWETREAVRNITHTKTASNAKPGKSLSAAYILRETVKIEPPPENSIEKLIDLLTSKGYLKILMNPTIEVINGKTAKIESSQRLPSGKEIIDSFEVTPQILDDGSIDVATKMVFQNKQIGDPRTHINIKDSESLVIGSVTKTEKRDIVRDGVKVSEERTTEVLVILTLTIITPEMNLSKKAAMQVKLTEKKDQKELSKFTRTLPNGVTVELVGICEYPSADKQWWRPDGTPFTLPAGIKVEDRISRVGDNAYQFLFRYNSQEDLMWNSLDAVCLHFSIEGDSGVSLINLRRPPKDGQDGLFAKVAIFKEPLDSTTIQANLATGNWQTQAVRDISNFDQRSEELYWFTSESAGLRVLEILHRIEGQQIKTIAIDREGNEYDASYSLGSFGGWASLSQIDGRRYVAGLRKDDRLVKFKLQSRPFWSSVIGNVSVKPNFKTAGQVEVEKTASDDSGGDSKRHQLVTFMEGMSIREALRFLGKAYKKNIIPSEKVAGQVPVNELYNVTFEEALQAVLGTHKYIIEGKFIRVYTEEEFESIYPEEKSNSRVEVEKSDLEVGGTEITAEKGSEFSAILPNGVTVELIGMCEYPSVGKQWWRPDGSLLVNPPYDESDIDILSFRKPDAIPIEFAFRLSGNLGEPAWEAKVKGEEQAFIWWTGRRSKNGKFLTDIKSIGMFVKSDQRTLNLRLGFSLADGPYEWVDFKNISIKPNFKPDVQVKGEPLDPHADNPRAVISAIIEQLKSAKYVHSGRGSADVVDVQTSSSYQSSSRSEKILEFRFEGNLSRSDAFTSEKGKRGDFECSWAVGPLSSVSYNNAYGSATVQARPFSQFYRQLGYDFHPETFPRMYQNSIVDLLEGMARQPQVTLKVTQEPKDVVRVVSESKNETSEQKLCILLINDADGMRLSSWEFTAKDLTEDGAGARRSSLRLKWKKYAGFWYISEAISEGAGVHDGLRSEGRTTVTIREFTPNVEIEDTEFTLDGLDIPPGAMVNDRILDTRYRYAGSKGYAADKLRKLSQAALMYANDYDNKFPDTIQQFKQFLDEKELKWLSENICYLGKGKTVLDPPETPLAYDRTMYEAEEAKGTNVLFVSGIVSFRTREQFKKLGITSEPKTDLPVEGKGGWGEAVEGVQVRLRADKYRWEAEEKPVFKADICNRGELELYVHAADEFCQLEIDGEWHGWSGPWGKIDDKQSRLGHGSQINDISISLAKTWVGKKSVLALTAGVHTVRAAFILQRSEREYQNVVRVVSNPVEIEVVSAKAKPTMQVEGEVEFKLITKPLTIKGIELQLPKVATLQYWNEVFDLDSETISYYEPGARRWPKGADVGFDIDFPQEIKGSVNWGINTGYKTTGHRFLALDSYSFEQAVLETFTKLDELRNSKWMGFGLSKLTLKKFPEFFAVLTDGYSVKANSTVEHPTPKLAIIEVVEARDKSAKIKYWLERKTQNKAAVEVEGEGLKTEIQEVVKGFWTAVTAEDWQAVNEYSEMDILKQRAGALEHVLAGVGAERKGLLSRGIDISRIDEVYVEGKEAIAIGPANGERYQWYYLQKRGDVWVIKLFDDAPPRMSVQDVFFKCRSVDKLMLMGERLTKYAAEHQGKLPENLEALEPYIPDKSLRAWLRQHVEYLGKAKEMEKTPNSTIAYTKTLVSKDENISALFNDGNVDFVRTSQVERDI